MQKSCKQILPCKHAPLAQMDRAQASDAWCRRFESAMVRQTSQIPHLGFGLFFVSWGENRLHVACNAAASCKLITYRLLIPHTCMKPGSDPPWCANKERAFPALFLLVHRGVDSNRLHVATQRCCFMQTKAYPATYSPTLA